MHSLPFCHSHFTFLYWCNLKIFAFSMAFFILNKVPNRRSTSAFITTCLLLLALLYYRCLTPQPLPQPEPEPKPGGDRQYLPGIPKLPAATYSRTLVIGRLSEEDVSWLSDASPHLNKAIYIVDQDDPSKFRIPRNKGHEAMVYLSYIIDHYYNLSDTTIFMHPHLVAWHNNDLLDSNALTTLKHLSDDHVARVGYFNTRCHHEPGCPDWLRLDRPDSELDTHRKMEEKSFSTAVWQELHPGAPLPHAISQPCCAQFAVSRERIQANPRSEYIRYRQWLLNTPLDDIMSGRVMEYTWQYLFTGQPEVCPAMNTCYCDGYGVCFGGTAEFDNWLNMRNDSQALQSKADELAQNGGTEEDVRTIRNEASKIDQQMEILKQEAFERGKDPANRAIECGRTSR